MSRVSSIRPRIKIWKKNVYTKRRLAIGVKSNVFFLILFFFVNGMCPNSKKKLVRQIPLRYFAVDVFFFLGYRASPRCIYQLRMLPPNITAQFSQDHDAAIAACLSELLHAGAIPATSLAIAHLPLSQGGFGLTSASVTATPVHWASWADIFPVLYNQMPHHAETLLHQLQHLTEASPAVQAALTAVNDLQEHGFAVPEWEALATGSKERPPHPSRDGPTHHRGWQQEAVHANHTSCEAKPPTPPRPSEPSLACLPTWGLTPAEVSPQSHTTSAPNIPHICSESSSSDACASPSPSQLVTAGAVALLTLIMATTAQRARNQGFSETAVHLWNGQRRVTTNTLLTDFIDHIHRQDDRRIEVIANGLPISGGAQLAVDTTIFSPLTTDGQPRRRAGQYAGTTLTETRRRKERTYPEFMRSRRCRLVVFGIETGGKWSEEAASFVKLLARAKARQAPRLLQHSVAAALINRYGPVDPCCLASLCRQPPRPGLHPSYQC